MLYDSTIISSSEILVIRLIADGMFQYFIEFLVLLIMLLNAL